MPEQQSFDITSGCEPQEVDNAINQANKELTQRYDFRNVKFGLEFKRDEDALHISAPDDFKLSAIMDLVKQKLVKRGVPIKNLKDGTIERATGGTVRQIIKLQQGIDSEVAKKIVKSVKDQKFKKVQASMQKDQVRVQSPSRDELQAAIAFLKGQDFGVALDFGNFRGG